MTLLNFEDPSRSPRKSKIASAPKKPLKLILGVGALASVIALGSTLAANIDLNTGAPIEFGQGVAQTVACSGSNHSITITPKSTFRNAEGAGSYRFSSFEVSNIPASCYGVDFTFKFYGANGAALDPINYDWGAHEYLSDFNRTDINVHFDGTATTGSGTNNLWDDNDFGFPVTASSGPVNGGDPSDSRTSSSFEVTFWYAVDALNLFADDLKSITVETSSTQIMTLAMLFDAHNFSGSTWTDTAGGYNATKYGTVDIGSANGGEVLFSTEESYFQLPTTIPHFANGITIDVIANFGTITFAERIIDFGNGAEADNIFLMTGQWNNTLIFSPSNNAYCTSPTNMIVPDTLQHFTITFDGGTCKMYENGVLQTEQTGFSPSDDVSRAYNYIGKSNWDDPNFNGTISLLAIYSEALTSAQVLASFNNYSARFDTTP